MKPACLWLVLNLKSRNDLPNRNGSNCLLLFLYFYGRKNCTSRITNQNFIIMKKSRKYIGLIVMLALLITSCSKDEQVPVMDSEKATLSFNALVQDLTNKATGKQVVGDDEIPACSDDEAAYVEIVLTQGDVEIVGSENEPYRVDLVAGEVFTKEDANLELTPGTYSLDHFSVYNADGDLLWVAPRAGSALAAFVDTTLPMDINLGAGVKKYVDVPVLCYDDRDTNEYGYQFFELDMTEMYEFCFFANYCASDGRHYPARISVEIEIEGVVVYEAEELVSTVGTDNNGDFFAEPVCFSVPDLAGYDLNEEYVDYTVTLLSWGDNYGEVDPEVITGSLSRAEILANHGDNDDVEYEHLRFGCGDDGEEPVDSDNDGVIDAIDQCQGTAAGVEVDNVGCPIEETDSDGDGVVDNVDNCPDTPAGVDVDGEGCPIDSDNDDVPDYLDECDNQAGPASNDGCPISTECIPAPAEGCETLQFTQTVDVGEFPVGINPFYALYVGDEEVGAITFLLAEAGDHTMTVSVDLFEGWTATDVEVSLPDFVNTEICVQEVNENDFEIVYEVDSTEWPEGLNYPLDVEFAANICF